jgi:hypothetical protein
MKLWLGKGKGSSVRYVGGVYICKCVCVRVGDIGKM